MAYITANLNLASQSLEGTAGTKRWTYTTTDTLATVVGAGYVTDATKKGMVKGDYVDVVNAATPSHWILEVSSISSGAATLADSAVQVGSAATSTIGFYGAAPVAQRTSSAQAAVATTAASTATPWGFTTSTQANGVITLLNEIQAALVALGLIKGS